MSDADDPLLDALMQTSFNVIAILRDHTPTMSELARYLGLDRSTVTGMIDRAEQRGLVERVENEGDKRSHRVCLTGAGQELAATGAAEITTGVAPHIERLKPAERARLTRLLQASTAAT